MSTWTVFSDMYSGGRRKTEYEHIYIEAPEKAAIKVFEQLFDRHPSHVTCACCGNDFSVFDEDSIEEATYYQRKDKKQSLEAYLQRPDIKVIRADEAKAIYLKDFEEAS